MSCAKKSRKWFLTILSLATCGLLVVMMVALVIFEKKKSFDQVSKTIWVVSIIILVISILLLIFAVYAAYRGKKRAKIALGIVFLIFMAILIIFAVCILALQKQILDWVGENYAKNELFKIVPEIVDCCPEEQGWETACQNLDACRTVLEKFLKDFGNVVAAILIIIAILLFIGSMVAFCFKCKCKKAKRWWTSSSSSS